MAEHLNTAALLDQLIQHEGLRLKPYKDTVGKLTIGVGRNLDDVGITEDEARMMLAADVGRTNAALDRAIPWWRNLDGVRQRVIADMAFNMGVAGLLTFKNTLAAVKEGRWDDASDGMLASKWARQVGGRAVRLARMMETGDDHGA
jgi:lysozyme